MNLEKKKLDSKKVLQKAESQVFQRDDAIEKLLRKSEALKDTEAAVREVLQTRQPLPI